MNGAFSKEFASRKRWKLNSGLQNAIKEATEPGDMVLDVGAGVGRYVEWLNELERLAVGLDGTQGIEGLSDGRVMELDFTSDDASDHIQFRHPEGFDLVLCIEVIEHIPVRLMSAFMDNLAKINTINWMVSCATINQRGRDHVSCHQPYWVTSQFGLRGIEVDEPETERLRTIAGKGWNHKLLMLRKHKTE